MNALLHFVSANRPKLGLVYSVYNMQRSGSVFHFILPVFHELVEVLLHVLKDKVKVVVLSDHLL